MVCWDAFPLSTQIHTFVHGKGRRFEFFHTVMNHFLMAAIDVILMVYQIINYDQI